MKKKWIFALNYILFILIVFSFGVVLTLPKEKSFNPSQDSNDFRYYYYCTEEDDKGWNG